MSVMRDPGVKRVLQNFARELGAVCVQAYEDRLCREITKLRKTLRTEQPVVRKRRKSTKTAIIVISEEKPARKRVMRKSKVIVVHEDAQAAAPEHQPAFPATDNSAVPAQVTAESIVEAPAEAISAETLDMRLLMIMERAERLKDTSALPPVTEDLEDAIPEMPLDLQIDLE